MVINKTAAEKMIQLIELQVFELSHKTKTLAHLVAELKLALEEEKPPTFVRMKIENEIK